MKSTDEKLIRLIDEYSMYHSSDQESENTLREAGLDPDQVVNETLLHIKRIKMKLEAESTQKNFLELRKTLLQRAKSEVEKLLSTEFNFGHFLKTNNINLAYRNFETMNESEIREFLERYFLLKYENEQNEG
ncbi:MAG: hypothetical protein QY309_03390 [Cyclobacteriaceae bacterium]|nr:MAG: hypothetical protein QY309_03390 [Cyclobacteriaceae bacterium]